MPTSKPSLELLRSMTDEHVLRAIMDSERLTRTEIAALTGISKPTISDSVRRLTKSGVLADTGERTTGRGRAGSYYSLAPESGAALVAEITPRGVRAEAVDAFGAVVAGARAALGRAVGQEEAAAALGDVAGQLAGSVPLRCAVISAADPVDRETGRLVRLPEEPFLVGDLDPVAVLAPFVSGDVLVDNDVNWSARAEREDGSACGVDNFVYLHLGEGLGAAVVADGEVRRGGSGLIGEIAHVITTGPDGSAIHFTEFFRETSLRQSATAAIDVDALRARYGDVLPQLADAIRGVVLAMIAFADPQLVVLGGTWGRDPEVLDALTGASAAPREVAYTRSTLDDPELAGARAHAIDVLRTRIIQHATEQ
ncbi:ROK family transcriptional regulator [Saccharopolyspora aridisoli]|uniref:ROK family transcriptional regulator n=1 Tax=Saccharopolyspora aridisoli TaxID=2530385 RepID=A0A4V2Y6U2_9PSEU|nr:ROK family transcriptional regulator [Saccharopolyspora aridisoli]TDC89545.1 ROK family transcriptional regulator [Saccharopolyspora aridisoli]